MWRGHLGETDFSTLVHCRWTSPECQELDHLWTWASQKVTKSQGSPNSRIWASPPSAKDTAETIANKIPQDQYTPEQQCESIQRYTSRATVRAKSNGTRQSSTSTSRASHSIGTRQKQPYEPEQRYTSVQARARAGTSENMGSTPRTFGKTSLGHQLNSVGKD